jgi:hypothetical protein
LGSPELIQQEDAAKEDAKGNPEMNVGCDGPEQVAGIVLVLIRQSCGLGVKCEDAVTS